MATLRLSHRVFVYGTLKRGEPNYYRLQDEANGRAAFLGEAKLCDRYPLVVATKYNVPMLLDAPGTGNVTYERTLELMVVVNNSGKVGGVRS